MTRVSIHIRPKKGVDPRLMAAFAEKPFEEVGVQSHDHGLPLAAA